MYNAFFSAKAAQQFGYNVYLDEAGNRVEVTYVTKRASTDPQANGYKWDDAVYVGRVTDHVSSHRPKINFYSYDT